jgi:hypothetical protein
LPIFQRRRNHIAVVPGPAGVRDVLEANRARKIKTANEPTTANKIQAIVSLEI